MRTITTTVVACLLAFAGCSKSEPSAAKASEPAATPAAPAKPARDPETAKKMIAGGALVFDVRTPEEFGGGHLPTATNIPIDELAAHLDDVAKLASNDKSRPIVVHCAKGGRAARAKKTLEDAGYTNVVNGGGYDDLK